MDQLRQLNIAIPNEIYKDLYQRKVWSAEADTQAAAKELSRATEFRPSTPLNNLSKKLSGPPLAILTASLLTAESNFLSRFLGSRSESCFS